MIRVAVVEDSAIAREALRTLLQKDNLHVVGAAATVDEALHLLKRHKPDVLVMDGRMKGAALDIVRQIMREAPLPIILLAGNNAPPDLASQARQAGAVAVALKPEPGNTAQADLLAQMVRTMAGVPVVHHWGRQKNSAAARRQTAPLVMPSGDVASLANSTRIIAIAASTGGPATVAGIAAGLPANFPWPVVVVQHMKSGFGGSMVDWLATQTALHVKRAEPGEVPQPATLYLAPDDYHVQFTPKGELELVQTPPYKTLRPSANPTFKSLAAVFGPRALGIILTGMGDDGADGLAALYQAGGFVIAQDEASCVVYGMPRAAVEMGVVHKVMSPASMVTLLNEMASRRN